MMISRFICEFFRGYSQNIFTYRFSGDFSNTDYFE